MHGGMKELYPLTSEQTHLTLTGTTTDTNGVIWHIQFFA